MLKPLNSAQPIHLPTHLDKQNCWPTHFLFHQPFYPEIVQKLEFLSTFDVRKPTCTVSLHARE